jgi:hypothetical protein
MDLKKLESTYLKPCGGEVIASLIGGSTLYGLNTPTSDVDYRGVYVARDKKYVAGFETMDSVVTSPHNQDADDSTYYEIGHYMKLLRKTNTQVLEILFADDSSFIHKDPLFDVIRKNKYSFIDTERLKASLKGYIFSELRLATGERSGRLGGARKQAVTDYGFSPKNFVQIYRLCSVGIRFFDTGEYMVNVKEFNPRLHESLMDIKSNPSNYTCEQLKEYIDINYENLVTSMEKSKIKFNFNIDLASDIILESRNV